MPIFRSYPETAFGGVFETEGGVSRISAVKEMIAKAHGWISGPPIRFSYNTPNKNPPMAFPVKPTWLLGKKDRALAVEQGFHRCNHGPKWNWFGTDDGGRDVIARLIYGFRISVLFGLVLHAVLVGVESRRARCRASSAAGWILTCASVSSRCGPPCRSSIS